MKTVLILQSRRRPEMISGEQEQYIRALAGTDATAAFLNVFDEYALWNDPHALLGGASAVILGGSGEFDFDGGRPADDPARATSKEILKRLTPLIAHLIAERVPTLGICYGHQIIGEFFGVPVENDLTQNKVGTFEVVLTDAGKQDSLLGALPERFLAQYGHKDSLSALPEGATLLAHGERCRYSALTYSDSMYTLQFHPELTAEDAASKLANSPGYLPEGVAVEEVIKPSPEASSLIGRFVNLFA